MVQLPPHNTVLQALSWEQILVKNVNLGSIPTKSMHLRVGAVPVEQPLFMKAQLLVLLANRGLSHRGDRPHVNLVVLVLTPIKQNQQAARSVLPGSMQNIADQQPAIRILTARPDTRQR